MNLIPILSASSALKLLILVGFALVYSSFVREKPWGIFIWLFPVLLFTWGSIGFAKRLLEILSVKGIDSGWGVMELTFVVPALAVLLLGLFICYLVRPAKPTRDLRIAVPAIVLYGATPFLFSLIETRTFEVTVIGPDDKPLAGAWAEAMIYNEGIGADLQMPVCGDDGKFEVTFKKNQTVTLKVIHAKYHHGDRNVPAFREIELRPDLSKKTLLIKSGGSNGRGSNTENAVPLDRRIYLEVKAETLP